MSVAMRWNRSCVPKVTKYLKENKHVTEFDVNLEEHKVTCTHTTDPNVILKEIIALGYASEILSNT
jgi:copper chaperone CopZ